jgi:uncharacterized repeat protein (TIGR01451 family)
MLTSVVRHTVAAFIFAVLLCGGASAASPTCAPAAPCVNLQLTGAAYARQPDGTYKEVALDSATLKSGDKVRYTILATNKGSAPALHLVPSDPFPARMAYVAGSATATSAATAEFTLDGKTWSAKPMVSVKSASGTVISKPAPASDYKGIRWAMTAPLAPQASAKFAFEVLVK